ncbi:tetratricopeptide repeat protein [Candidatus Uabimicrobium sp. HlEnr_7]|uniref:tetratricopeptide repeat protein n=1 Tax=Candidatus Uabimicrobium helgolandensis TaxID=3095367 RepID=UPI0035579530
MKSRTFITIMTILTLLPTIIFANDLWEKGQALENDSWEQAIEYYTGISEKYEDKPLIASKAYERIAHCYTRMGEKLMAADCYVYACELIESEKKTKRQQQEWMAYAALYYEDARKWELAAECYIKASELTENKLFANKYRVNAGRAYEEIGNFVGAIEVCSLALKNAQNNIERSAIVKDLWKYKLEQARVDTSDGNHNSAGKQYQNYAQYLFENKREKLGKKYLQESLQAYQKTGNNAEQANIYAHLASLSEERQQYSDAFIFLTACIEAEGQNTPQEQSNNFEQSMRDQFKRLETFIKQFIKVANRSNRSKEALQKIEEVIIQLTDFYSEVDITVSGQKASKLAKTLSQNLHALK